MDCIVLAGSDRQAYRRLPGESNKAFLEVAGQPIVCHIVQELLAVDALERILIVGPLERLERTLAPLVKSAAKPILLFQEQKGLIQNAMTAFNATGNSSDKDRTILVTAADTPLLTAEEVQQFIANVDLTQCDYAGGMTREEDLVRFYPSEKDPGIVLNYFYFPSGRYRVNNLHLGKPLRCKHIQYIQEIYRLRYMMNPLIVLKSLWLLVKLMLKSPRAIFFYIGMQTAFWLRTWGFRKLANRVIQPFTLRMAETCISDILGLRFKVVLSQLGGCALDVDNAEDLATIHQRFDEWKAKIKENNASRKLGP